MTVHDVFEKGRIFERLTRAFAENGIDARDGVIARSTEPDLLASIGPTGRDGGWCLEVRNVGEVGLELRLLGAPTGRVPVAGYAVVDFARHALVGWLIDPVEGWERRAVEWALSAAHAFDMQSHSAEHTPRIEPLTAHPWLRVDGEAVGALAHCAGAGESIDSILSDAGLTGGGRDLVEAILRLVVDVVEVQARRGES